MLAQGVLISYSSTKSKKEDTMCSGILFADKWVLTTGALLDTLFQNFIKKSHSPMKQFSKPDISIVPLSVLHSFPKFSVLVSNDSGVEKLTVSTEEKIDRLQKYQSEHRRVDLSSSSFQQCQRRIGRLAALWRCPLVTESTNQLLSGWQLTPEASKDHDVSAFKILMSTFLLVNLDGENLRRVTLAEVMSAMGQLFDQLKRPQRGGEVVIESTIFGREFFFNSWSQGIVSKVFGSKESLLLTDARAASGCEGGPIFAVPHSDGARALLGMVVSPLCWLKGEWVGFTLAVSLKPIISRLHSWSPTAELRSPSTPTEFAKVEKGLDSRVVLVRCGAGWGSGVVVDRHLGLIMTCTHVVSRWDCGIRVWCEGVSLQATLVYRNNADQAYDLALIRVTPPAFMQQVVMQHSLAVKGEPVYVAGYPLFSEWDQGPVVPMVSRGVVAHVSPGMLQTTCCVQSGASGGPVLRASGEMVAIVCCNANNLDTGALFPHVNMAVPTAAFARHVDRYRETLDVESLRPLEESDPLVQKMWKMQFTISKL